MIVFGNTTHAERVAKDAGCIFNPAVDQVISRQEGIQLYAGVVYQGYTGKSIEAHITGFIPGWASKDFLWVIFDYPFNQLGCELVLLQIPSRNRKALAFASRLGFKDVVYIDEVYPDCGLNILSMRRTECRWTKIACRASRLMKPEELPCG
jgi:hypothetical protein